MADGVVIKIKGDASEYKKTLTELKNKSAAVLSGIKSAGRGAATVFKGASAAVGGVTAALSAAGIAAVKYNGTIEQLQTSFEVMTGSAKEAASMVERIRRLDADTPFEKNDLASVTQMLMNYGLSGDEALSRMSMLGDIAQGNAEKLTRVATAYGQMRSSGKVLLEDVKQMIEAGFNPLQQISEQTGESMVSLYERISDGTLAVDEITQAMTSATSAGGKYYRSMEKQAQTVNGLISTLKDNSMQLLGDLFAPASESLRSDLLPEAIDVIDELSRGFATGGIDGLTAKLNRIIPELLTKLSGGLEKTMSGAAAKLPGLVRGLVGRLPQLIGIGSSFGKNITSALFSSLSGAVSELILNLPTLAPALLAGIGDMLGAVVNGAGELVFNAVYSLAQLMSGSKGKKTLESAWDSVLEAADGKERIITLDAAIEGDIETSGAVTAVETAFSEITTALTDGKADTEEIITGLNDLLSEAGQLGGSDIDRYIANLDPTSSGYSEAVAQAENDKEILEGYVQAAKEWIDTYAGESTAVVQAHLDELLAIEAEINRITEKYTEAEEAVNGVAENAYKTVASGARADADDIDLAFSYTYNGYQSAEEALDAEYEAAKQELQNLEMTPEAYNYKLGELDAEFELKRDEISSRYEEQLLELLRGLSKSQLDTETQEALDGVFDRLDLAASAQQWLDGAADSMGMVDMSTIPQELRQALYDAGFGYILSQELIPADELQTAWNSTITSINESATETITNTDFGDLGTVMRDAMEQGLFDGTAFEDMDMSGIMSAVFSAGGDMADTAADGVRTGYSDMESAGSYTGSGFERGLAARRASIISTARGIANAVSDTMRAALDINSPSGVTEYIGEMTGEGFEIGGVRSFRKAISRIENTVSDMNLRPGISAGELGGMFDSAVISMGAMSTERPVILQINGKTIARVIAGDMRAATNLSNHEVYMGYGK